MLRSLSIKNYALIDDLKVSFLEGLTVITGETGSGKSILLDALSLILGKRADLGSLRNPEQKCIIEAEFFLENYQMQHFFEQEDMDYEPVTFVRREILPSGKSRAFVNDTPVTLDVLTKLGKILVDIHSQHETQQLSQEDFQFYVLDVLGDNQPVLQEYKKAFSLYKKDYKKLKELQEFQKNANKEYDYNSFMLRELEQEKLQEGIQEELEEIYSKAANTEQIQQSFSSAQALLSDDEQGILAQLLQVKNEFSRLVSYSPDYQEIYNRIENIYVDLDDVAQEIYNLSDEVDFDPNELEKIHAKLQRIYDLQKKHSVGSVAELLQIQQRLEMEVSQTENIEETIAQQKEKAKKSLQKITELSAEIHKRRAEIIPKLTQELQSVLAQLGMPNAQFKIELSVSQKFLNNGKDELSFLFSANKGGNFGVLKKTASGGELSRIMLVVKHILATKAILPTIIFDEIDTGVSGEISHKMGEIMKQMSQSRQVFAITHLPQVASKGKEHIKVFKTEINSKTTTQLSKLSQEQRIEEIAQMLAGENVTESARTHAQQLLMQN